MDNRKKILITLISLCSAFALVAVCMLVLVTSSIKNSFIVNFDVADAKCSISQKLTVFNTDDDVEDLQIISDVNFDALNSIKKNKCKFEQVDLESSIDGMDYLVVQFEIKNTTPQNNIKNKINVSLTSKTKLSAEVVAYVDDHEIEIESNESNAQITYNFIADLEFEEVMSISVKLQAKEISKKDINAKGEFWFKLTSVA